MRRWLCILVLVSLSGCSSRSFEKGWSAGWAVVSAPVLVVCTPYNALWDLAFWQDRAVSKGLTASMWKKWRKATKGRGEGWAAPLALIIYPLATVLQPLPSILHLLAGIPVS